jgi:hypothetical protein
MSENAMMVRISVIAAAFLKQETLGIQRRPRP